ncbi:TadE/TadG family type IV pilus assembly protein [Kitasatospora purpeofusca]|uniref:TadE/TadG family type IV pilus assembly protein n=1 Tax=Kitasatospora purpeofusca TaxID=67352 RepID=UPI0035DFA9BF
MPADDTTRWRRAVGRMRGDDGLSTVELVIGLPFMVFLALLLTALVLMVQSRSALDGTARDAARAGALQRSYQSAVSEATRAARASAAQACANGAVSVSPSGDWRPGGMFTVTVSCNVRGLAWLGLNINSRVSSTSTAPLDTFRRAS